MLCCIQLANLMIFIPAKYNKIKVGDPIHLSCLPMIFIRIDYNLLGKTYQILVPYSEFF